MIPPLSIHRSVAVTCQRCSRKTNVVLEGQCVACHLRRAEAKPTRRLTSKPRQGQHG